MQGLIADLACSSKNIRTPSIFKLEMLDLVWQESIRNRNPFEQFEGLADHDMTGTKEDGF